MPASLLRALGPSEEHAKAHRSSQRYMTDKINFSSICRTISLFETFLLLTGFINHMLGFPFPDGWTGLRGLWNVAADLTGAVGKSGVMWHSMSFLLVTTILGTFTEMPKVSYSSSGFCWAEASALLRDGSEAERGAVANPRRTCV